MNKQKVENQNFSEISEGFNGTTRVRFDEKGEGVISSSQSEVETYENPNLVPNSTTVNQRNLNYSKQKSSVNYNVSKEVKQVIYAPGTLKRLSIAVAVNKILTDSEKEEVNSCNN